MLDKNKTTRSKISPLAPFSMFQLESTLPSFRNAVRFDHPSNLDALAAHEGNISHSRLLVAWRLRWRVQPPQRFAVAFGSAGHVEVIVWLGTPNHCCDFKLRFWNNAKAQPPAMKTVLSNQAFLLFCGPFQVSSLAHLAHQPEENWSDDLLFAATMWWLCFEWAHAGWIEVWACKCRQWLWVFMGPGFHWNGESLENRAHDCKKEEKACLQTSRMKSSMVHFVKCVHASEVS